MDLIADMERAAPSLAHSNLSLGCRLKIPDYVWILGVFEQLRGSEISWRLRLGRVVRPGRYMVSETTEHGHGLDCTWAASRGELQKAIQLCGTLKSGRFSCNVFLALSAAYKQPTLNWTGSLGKCRGIGLITTVPGLGLCRKLISHHIDLAFVVEQPWLDLVCFSSVRLRHFAV